MMSKHCIVFILFTFLVLLAIRAEAEEVPILLTPDFQDLNGDGMNDLLKDSDCDGIPDVFDTAREVIGGRPMLARPEFSFIPVESVSAIESGPVERFLARQFSIRDLIFEQARCLNIAISEVGSVNQGSQICIGGVCIGP